MLSNVAPPSLRRKAATENILQITKAIQIGLCMLMSFSIYLHSLHLDAQYGRHDTCRHKYAVDRGLVVGFCGQPHYCYRPYYPTARFRSPSSYTVSDNRFRAGQGPCRANLHKWGLAQSPSCDCGQLQTTNHIVDTCPLTKFEGGLDLLYEADDDAVIWLESTATAALAK